MSPLQLAAPDVPRCDVQPVVDAALAALCGRLAVGAIMSVPGWFTDVVILHHVLEGAGPALLMLHSTATDARQWRPQIRDLRDAFAVVAPDLRGHGGSPLNADPFSHAGDVVRLMDELGLERFAMVGSSGGGAVALQVACMVPKRVSALVLLCAAANGVEPTADLRAFAEQETRLLHSGDVAAATNLSMKMWLQPEMDGATRELFGDMQLHAFHMQLAAGGEVHEEDPEIDLSRITCPATVVSGDLDLPWFRSVADYLVAELPRAVHVNLSWAGHLPNLERPTDTTELIRRSLLP